MSPEAKEDKPWQWNRMTTSTGCARQPRARQPRGTQNTIESIVTSWKQWNQTQMKTSLGSETVRQQVQDARGSRAEHKILLNLLCQSKSNEPRCKWRQALAVKPYDNKYRMCAAAARSTKYHWIFRDKPKAKSPEAHEDKPWQWNRMTTSTGCARQPRGAQNTIQSIVTSRKQRAQKQMKTSLGTDASEHRC